MVLWTLWQLGCLVFILAFRLRVTFTKCNKYNI